jgi:EAL domain-containing protein (putative c-di-GMP-specific phosphodiesterase class I)/GGDEF domain-containing protein
MHGMPAARMHGIEADIFQGARVTPLRGLLSAKTTRSPQLKAGVLDRAELALELEGALALAVHHGRPLVVVRISVQPTLGRGYPSEQLLHAQRACAERIAGRLSESDLLAQLDQLEFAAVVQSIEGPGEVAGLVHGLLDAFRRPLLAGAGTLQMQATAGVALYPRDGVDAHSLLDAADRAAARAAADVPGHLAFSSPELDAAERWDREARAGLGPALERGELVLHYQPVLDMRHGDVAAVEALIRWQHPARGLVPPLEFIPTAEHTGQIVAIGKWALMRACQQARTWERAGMPVRMAVNLSVRQFSAPDLVDHVEHALRETGLRPDRLELELTESMFADPVTSTRILERLHRLGVRVAIDDFGTGFSSLSYLTRFPLDTIKLDRSFISQAAHDRDAAAVVGSVIAMAHELNLKAVAEGVETEEQERLLKTQGCDLLQGFLHSPPLAARDCERWLRQHLGRPQARLAQGVLSGQQLSGPPRSGARHGAGGTGHGGTSSGGAGTSPREHRGVLVAGRS